MTIESENILVRVLETPNPMAVKLVVNFALKNEGKATFNSKEQLEESQPLFLNFFKIKGVSQLHVFENQITLNHEGLISFEEIERQGIDIIKKWGSEHNPDFQSESEEEEQQKRDKLSDEERQVEEILDRTVRPGLQADGGDLEVISFKENKIEISYQGACGGCPSSYMDTLFAIENILRYELKNDKIEVYPVS